MPIQELTLRNFRGIAGPLTVTLLQNNGCTTEAVSTDPILIYGQNGSGKSSICDGIEFGLRGVTSRRSAGGEKVRREIQHLFDKEAPGVTLTLTDGRQFRRGSNWTGEGKAFRGVIDGFEVCPVVVRRSAIDGFWQVSPVQRLDFFWDYLKPLGVEWRTEGDERALEQHTDALRRLATVEAELRTRLPTTYNGLPFALPKRAAAVDIVRQGISDEKRRRNLPVALTSDEKALIARHKVALAGEEALRSAGVKASQMKHRSRDDIADLLRTAAPRVAEDFRAISGQDWVEDVRIEIEGSSLDVWLVRQSGKSLEPTSILSEAYLDLLALLIVIEVHIACESHGQQSVLVLDDVFQSVDGTLRQRVLRHLCSKLKGWQVVMTVHDRLWLELAAQIFRENGSKPSVIELRHNSRGRTPTVVKGGTGPLRDIDFVQSHAGSAVLLAGATGRALEALLDRLSVSLRCKMVRQDPEKYMINDLLGAVLPVLQNCANNEVRSRIKNVGRAQFLRNAVGAHFNVNADTISEQEVDDVTTDVKWLWSTLSCNSCNTTSIRGEMNNGKWEIEFPCKHS